MKPRILFLSGREIGYIRNRVLLAALRAVYDVTVLTADANNIPTRIAAGLARFAGSRPPYDLCIAGFYGQPLAIALALLQHKPIILDAYVSTFDTLCMDRARFTPHSPAGRLAYWLDRRGCQVATRVVTDTAAHAHYFAQTFGIPASRLVPIYVGCDQSLFYPRPDRSNAVGPCEVFYYGSFLPLHGSDVIVQAAALLSDRADIHFTLGGDGAGFKAIQHRVADWGLTNVDLVGWIAIDDLPSYIARAAICLGGHFSTSPKAARVIATKTFQFIAMGKPTIVGDNPATRELFIPGEHVMAIPMGDAHALASAIRQLADDRALRANIAAGGYAIYQERCTTGAIAQSLAAVIEEALCASVS